MMSIHMDRRLRALAVVLALVAATAGLQAQAPAGMAGMVPLKRGAFAPGRSNSVTTSITPTPWPCSAKQLPRIRRIGAP